MIVPQQPGSVGILNVGHGDTKLSFDDDNPADCIRAARIVKDMLRRGYALLVEVEQTDGSKKFQRVYEFKADTFEYVIADLDPEIAAAADAKETADEHRDESQATPRPEVPAAPRGRRGKTKTLSAKKSRAVAIGRTAGG